MSTAATASATTAPTEFLRVKDETYAYRRIGVDSGGPCSVCNISPARWTTGIPP
jgi:hypothetical protein